MPIRKPPITYHEVALKSNLDLLIRGFHGIANRAVDAVNSVGAGLQAIALALSTPEDNSDEVKAEIERLRKLREGLQRSIDNQTKEN